ncbi:endonuclease III [Candidatus Woesearchaeota archaeon]|nr:endonuclease III [Candidatus Woesearchaeota archaeon]
MLKAPKNIGKIIKLLKKEIRQFKEPIATEIGEKTKDPFLVLISCIMSLRTLKLSKKQIEKAIFPVGFYPTKAKYIIETCKILIEKYDGEVPDNEEELLQLPGIGRKCMGIVMCYGFGKNSHIPTDTHVHKLANRLGWVKTKTPEKTEIALTKTIPRKYWHDLNNLLVAHGQNVCVPVSPFCSKCAISKYCPKIGVKKSR